MRALLFRVIAGFLVLPGVVCVLFPFAVVALPGGQMLLDDTRALLGAGTSEGVPVVHRVTCREQRYGGSSLRSVPSITEYECDLLLAKDPEAKEEDPYVGMTYDDAMRAYSERIRARVRGEGTFPIRIERTFANDVSTRPPPSLRLLSEEGETPPRYGVVFGGGELARRWLRWLITSVLLWGFGVACFAAARETLRKARGHRP